MKTINIGGREYKVKYTIRALFLFEQITKKPFKIETLLDNYIFFYCIILANNKEDILEWDTFIDALDSDKELYNKMNKLLQEEEKKNEVFEDVEEEAKKGEQKKN